MATMHPARLSDEIRQDPGRQAEVAVFDALAERLGNRYQVFYSVEWNAAAPDDVARDGEADFVIAHPQHGFLVLEVKGGIVAYDPDTDRWSSTSKSGRQNAIRDPFKQSRDSCYGLRNRLKSLMSGAGALQMFHAAAFPHCLIRADGLPGCTRPELVIDVEGVREIDVRIERAFAYWRNGTELRGPTFGEVLAAIHRIHRPAFCGSRNLSVEIAEHQREFDRLTHAQLKVMDFFAGNRKLVVRGCAGSGKTFLARRLAVRRAERGERVLVLCYNNLLGAMLQEELGGLDGLTAANFHRACEAFARRANVPLPSQEDEGGYYDRLPHVALEAIGADPALRFDTVIVDEAQDFRDDWWVVVFSLLAGDDSSLAVFLDANQLLYDGAAQPSELFRDYASLQLPENLRNTQAIHREAIRHYEGETPPAIGPEGISPRWIEAEGAAGQLDEVAKLLDRLIDVEKVAPQDLAILTPKGAQSSVLAGLERVGKHPIAPYGKHLPGVVGWSTIRKFKGLESPVVVLVELDDDAAASSRFRELAYVGITRARDYLYGVATRVALAKLR